nr:cytochrome P450 [Streptomyces sp. B3I8]
MIRCSTREAASTTEPGSPWQQRADLPARSAPAAAATDAARLPPGPSGRAGRGHDPADRRGHRGLARWPGRRHTGRDGEDHCESPARDHVQHISEPAGHGPRVGRSEGGGHRDFPAYVPAGGPGPAAHRRYQRASSRLRRTVTTAVTDRLAAPGRDNGGGEDLLSLLMGAEDAAGDEPGPSDTELIDQAVSFFVASVETTATTLAWALHLLSRHADVEQRLRAEADAVLAGRPAAYDDLPPTASDRQHRPGDPAPVPSGPAQHPDHHPRHPTR